MAKHGTDLVCMHQNLGPTGCTACGVSWIESTDTWYPMWGHGYGPPGLNGNKSTGPTCLHVNMRDGRCPDCGEGATEIWDFWSELCGEGFAPPGVGE